MNVLVAFAIEGENRFFRGKIVSKVKKSCRILFEDDETHQIELDIMDHMWKEGTLLLPPGTASYSSVPFESLVAHTTTATPDTQPYTSTALAGSEEIESNVTTMEEGHSLDASTVPRSTVDNERRRSTRMKPEKVSNQDEYGFPGLRQALTNSVNTFSNATSAHVSLPSKATTARVSMPANATSPINANVDRVSSPPNDLLTNVTSPANAPHVFSPVTSTATPPTNTNVTTSRDTLPPNVTVTRVSLPTNANSSPPNANPVSSSPNVSTLPNAQRVSLPPNASAASTASLHNDQDDAFQSQDHESYSNDSNARLSQGDTFPIPSPKRQRILSVAVMDNDDDGDHPTQEQRKPSSSQGSQILSQTQDSSAVESMSVGTFNDKSQSPERVPPQYLSTFQLPAQRASGLLLTPEQIKYLNWEYLGFTERQQLWKWKLIDGQQKPCKAMKCFCPGHGCTSCNGQPLQCTKKPEYYKICDTCMKSLLKTEDVAKRAMAQQFEIADNKVKALSGIGSTLAGQILNTAREDYKRYPNEFTFANLLDARKYNLFAGCSQWRDLCENQCVWNHSKSDQEMIELAFTKIAQYCPRQFMFALGCWFTDGSIKSDNNSRVPKLSFSQAGYNVRLIRSFLVAVKQCAEVFPSFPIEKPSETWKTLSISIIWTEIVEGKLVRKAKVPSIAMVPLLGDNADNNVEKIEEFGFQLFRCAHDPILKQRGLAGSTLDNRILDVKRVVKEYMEGTAYWNDLKGAMDAEDGYLWRKLAESDYKGARVTSAVRVEFQSWILVLFEYFGLGHSRTPTLAKRERLRVMQERIIWKQSIDIMVTSMTAFLLGAIGGDGSIGPYPWKHWVEGKTFLEKPEWSLTVDACHAGWFQRLICKTLGIECILLKIEEKNKVNAELWHKGGLRAFIHACKQFKQAQEEMRQEKAGFETERKLWFEEWELWQLNEEPQEQYDAFIIPRLKSLNIMHFAKYGSGDALALSDSFHDMPEGVLSPPQEWFDQVHLQGWTIAHHSRSFTPTDPRDYYWCVHMKLLLRMRPHHFPDAYERIKIPPP